MSQQKKELNKYIESARTVKPRQSVSKLRSALETAAADSGRPTFLKYLELKRGDIIMATSFAALFAALLFYGLGGDETHTSTESTVSADQIEADAPALLTEPATPQSLSDSSSNVSVDASERATDPDENSQHTYRQAAAPEDADPDADVIFQQVADEVSMVKGSRLLDLSPSELKKLGIVHNANELNTYYSGINPAPAYFTYVDIKKRLALFPMELDHPADTMKTSFRNSSLLRGTDFGGKAVDGEAEGLVVPDFVPVCVMLFWGETIQFWYLDESGSADGIFVVESFKDLPKNNQVDSSVTNEVAMSDALNHPAVNIETLLPIHINLPGTEEEDIAPLDVILWYQADEAFINLLPERIVRELDSENDVLTSVIDEHLDVDAGAQRLTGDPYFDVWRSRAGALELEAVSPNPAGSQAHADIHVLEARTLRFSLHDIFGRTVAHIKDLTVDAGYRGSVEIDTSERSSGIYLLAITSELGEQVVQRLIVRH